MEKLALLGGTPSVTPGLVGINQRPFVTRETIDKTVQMMTNGEISISPAVRLLEERFALWLGVRHVLAVCNGTTAILEALYAAGVCPGDEVIVPSYTFWAGVAPVVALQAKPVFCDVDEETYNLSPAAIEQCITGKTKAIVPVHVWGNPCDMPTIMALAGKRGLAVVEDCAHAHGAVCSGRKTGLWGDVNMFSLQGSKVMRAGEGGLLVTDDAELFERAAALGHYERLAGFTPDSPYRKYSLTGLGFKHRMHPLGAQIALSDLETLDEMNDLRDRQGKCLDDKLRGLPFISFQKVLPGSRRLYAYHYARYHADALCGVSLQTFLYALKAEGMTVGVCGYGRLHEAPLFTGGAPDRALPHGRVTEHAPLPPPELPVTTRLRDSTFMLAPRFEVECPELIEAYAAGCLKVWENREALLKYERQNPPDAGAIEKTRSNSVVLI